MSPSIYNAADGPLAVDRAGRMIGAGESRPVGDLDVDASPLSGHIAAERIVVLDDTATDDHTDDTQPADQTATARSRKGRASTSTPQEG